MNSQEPEEQPTFRRPKITVDPDLKPLPDDHPVIQQKLAEIARIINDAEAKDPDFRKHMGSN